MTGFVFSRNQKMRPRYTMGCGPSSKSADLPMLAKRVDELPAEGDWVFEPKWDGFRAMVFRDGDEIFIQSRNEKPLNRYFPELLEPLRAV
jgi:ATP-dependent DNA ligase